MSAYSAAVFLHIVGALALFAGIGVEQTALLNLRRASGIAQLREWMAALRALRRVNGPASLVIAATGFYLVATSWRGRHSWVAIGLLGLVAMAVLGALVTGRRMAAIAKEMPAGDGPIPPALRQRIHDPVLRASVSLRTAIALGVVFDMSVKPGTVVALGAMGVALALGLAAAAVGWADGRSSCLSGPARQSSPGA